jgi:hypothetical protein
MTIPSTTAFRLLPLLLPIGDWRNRLSCSMYGNSWNVHPACWVLRSSRNGLASGLAGIGPLASSHHRAPPVGK